MRLIDADALLHELTEMVRHNTGEYKYGIQAARLVVMDTPTVGGWISVKDRLPEHGKRYLIYATSGDNKIDHITTASFGGHFVLTGRCAYWKVTHWMPLPEPPKEEENANAAP